MHICDCCCWFVNEARGCEAPRAFKERACQEAAKRKDELDAEKKIKKSKKSEAGNEDPTVAKRIENCSNVETVCSQCKKKYKAMTTRDYNNLGMYIEYSFCPDCHNKNLTSWHVW